MDRPLTQEEQLHFLVRTRFSVTRSDLERLRRIGLNEFVDEMLVFDDNAAVEATALTEIEDLDFPRDYELVHWWLHLMMRTPNPFREVLAMFWHDHFATSQRVLSRGAKYMFLDHVQMLRRLGNGNLRDLLHAVMIDPAVQVWLDGVENDRDEPNENLAREFWEIFSLGLDNGYTEDDITESARALTGYVLARDNRTGREFVVFDPARHDPGDKTVFGMTGPWQAPDIVDLTIDQRSAAEHVCRALFAHFCYSGVPPAVVQRLAGILRQNRYELVPVLRTILRSKAFFSPTAMQARVKSPVEEIVGFIRTTGLEMRFGELNERLLSLGNQPTNPPSVGGWPEGLDWLASQSMLERGGAVNEAVTSREHQFRLGLGLETVLPDPQRRSAEDIVDELLLLLRVDASMAERQLYIDYLNTHVEEDPMGNLVTTPSPFLWTARNHVDERVRGLLFLIAQHPTYHLR